MPESRGKGLKPPKVDYNLKFLGLYAFLGISFSYLKLTHGKPLCAMKFSLSQGFKHKEQCLIIPHLQMFVMHDLISQELKDARRA